MTNCNIGDTDIKAPVWGPVNYDKLREPSRLAMKAAPDSYTAWTITGRRSAYVLTEAPPARNPLGKESFNKGLLLDRTRKAWEMAEAWKAARFLNGMT